MCDFDLSQALDCSPESHEERFESSCFDMEDVKSEIFRLNEDLDLMVSHNRKTMQSVALLVLGVNRMKKPLNLHSRKLSDYDVVNIMDSVVEETVWNPLEEAKRKHFLRANSEKECTLCDHWQKDLVLSGDLQLQAITLKGGNYQHKVNFKMSRYNSSSVTPGDGLTVVLSININLHISCRKKDDNVVLTLEKYDGDISTDGDMERFLFYKKTTGISMTTFESVKFRGWFISTSEYENQPVELCKVDTASRLTCFRVN
ncbi:interleukin-1 beta [Archocentrus centrarchus]|uniref:interleukin-1 beta n=1 Tax=Archocentrus centrarchus TaxID=63155 RepID=UPI0011E9C16A|nr:interleukin-1 beta-like [Archocentrus centrarchus]